MKIFHLADLHLGSNIGGKLKSEKKQLGSAVRTTFENILEKAEKENVSAILLSGDTFDDGTKTSDKAVFFELVEKHKDILFFYLKGNHDESATVKPLENLKTFSPDEWKNYDLGECVIIGREMKKDNFDTIYEGLDCKPENCNIVMMHGEVSSAKGEDKVCLGELSNRHIDYLALGHIHKTMEKPAELDDRGVYVMPGCPQGRGVDECGKHGFYSLDIENGKINATFVPFAEITIYNLELDLSSLNARSDVYPFILEKMEEAGVTDKDMLTITLSGDVVFPFENIDADVNKKLENKVAYLVPVLSNLHEKINPEQYKEETSLRGEFVRKVMASELDEETKKEVLERGLKLFEREGN